MTYRKSQESKLIQVNKVNDRACGDALVQVRRVARLDR